MNFYSHHIGDFNNATRHLDRLERSIYRDLLELYYDTEKPLTTDFDRLARRCLVADDERGAMRDVLNEFFELTDDGYRNKRADREIAAYQRMGEGGKRGAAKRWAKPEDSPPIATPSPPQVTPNANHEPVTNNHKPKEVDSGSAQAQTPPPAYLGDENEAEIPGKARVLLSGSWELPAGWGQDAEALGWAPAEIMREAEKFRQYYVSGKGGGTRRGLKGWRQSWSNWLANAEKFTPIRRIA